MSRCRRGGFLLTDAFRIDRLSSLTLFSFGRAGVDYLFYFDRDRSGLFYFHTLILFLFILSRSRQEWGFRLFILVWVTSVLIVPSVFDLIWGVWDFPVENREKLSVSTLNKLGFVNDVEGFLCFFWRLEAHTL